MAKSAVTLNNALRNDFLRNLVNLLVGENPDDPAEVLQVGSGKLALPVVDEEGNEKWVLLTVSVPKGTRDGDEYDGYAEAEFYQREVAEKEEKKQSREAEKARKQAEREAKKAEREAKKQAEQADEE